MRHRLTSLSVEVFKTIRNIIPNPYQIPWGRHLCDHKWFLQQNIEPEWKQLSSARRTAQQQTVWHWSTSSSQNSKKENDFKSVQRAWERLNSDLTFVISSHLWSTVGWIYDYLHGNCFFRNKTQSFEIFTTASRLKLEKKKTEADIQYCQKNLDVYRCLPLKVNSLFKINFEHLEVFFSSCTHTLLF